MNILWMDARLSRCIELWTSPLNISSLIRLVALLSQLNFQDCYLIIDSVLVLEAICKTLDLIPTDI